MGLYEIYKKKVFNREQVWNRGGYNFDKWLEDARECTLRSIFIIKVPSLEHVQSEVKQGNFVPTDRVCLNCQEFGHITSLCPKEKLFTLVEANEDKLIDKKIPKFDDRKLVNNKQNVLSCEDKGVILKEHKLKEDVIFLSCSMNGEGYKEMPLIAKIEHKMPLEIFINMKELANLGALKIKKGNFQELSYVVNFESYFGKQICDLKSYMPCIELEENMMFSSLVGELNKNLRTSFIFQ